jgi:hypothetical protein
MDVALVLGGSLLVLIGWVWILIMGFSESILWGIGIFLLSPLAFVFGILHWNEAKIPVILMAVGTVGYVFGKVI